MKHALSALVFTTLIVAGLVGIGAFVYLICLAVTGHAGAWIPLGVVLVMLIFAVAWKATAEDMNR